MGAVNRSSRRGKAKAISDASTSRVSRGRHSVSSFPTIPDHLIGDAMTDEEFDQIYSGRGDGNLSTLDSVFEDFDEAHLDNLDGDEEPTPQSNDVDVETAVEREFSASGNILTDFRSCLSAESLETLVCNQDWLLARRRAQESSYLLESEHYMNATTDGSPSSEE
ncbi:unnamed protein product [Cuscuta campestris]|uniref:HAT C-terminal dimerisation domain-containing protein n=1 Tax=Cuscuta campestris TaxID=132261 RepID=A0A484NH95_9ASTE|nr:unnamed protein product [Cuscuta campestris]